MIQNTTVLRLQNGKEPFLCLRGDGYQQGSREAFTALLEAGSVQKLPDKN